MKYVIPYSQIKKTLAVAARNGAAGGNSADEIEAIFFDVIKPLLLSVDVDEDWYREQYPDVAKAVDAGLFSSARQHFIDSGYFEGRLPAPLTIDEIWYASQYPDVVDGVMNGKFSSLAQHFREHGYQEGRNPFAL